MNKTKHLVVLLALAAAALFGAQAASAAPLNLTNGDKITLDWNSPPTYGHAFGGGEFEVKGVGVNAAANSFLTFCIEYPEHISLAPSSYYVKINTSAVQGGSGVSGTYSGDPSGVAGSFDPLSNATAWLYTQFRNNTLSSFVNDTAHANALQLAIWHLENELQGSATDTSSSLYAYNHSTLATNWVNLATNAGWTNLGNVRVLNLYDTYSNGVFSGNHQDQLYLLPVPEPEIYAMMGIGLGLMGWVARRRAQQVA